jgi:hypothetical protein
MPDKIYKTLAEIDADLDKIYEEKEEPTKEAAKNENVAEENVEETTQENTEQENTADQTDKVEAKKPEVKKPTNDDKPKDNKQDYAFKQLREEANVAKKQLQNYEASLHELDELAQAQGFKNHKEFLAAWKEKQIEAQAKQRNMDPAVLKELNETKQRLTKIEEEKKNAEQQITVGKINGTIDKFAAKYKLDEATITSILNKMGEDNVTIESLVITPIETLEKMLTGYAQDIIVERKVQERLATLEANGTSAAPEKHKNTTTTKKADPFSKEALDNEMESYKRDNFPWLFKK